MTKKNQVFLNWLNVLSDALLIFISYLISVFVRFYIFDGEKSLELTGPLFMAIAILYSMLVSFVYYVAKLYQSQRLRKMGGATFKIVIINGIGTLFFMSGLYLFKVTDFSRWTIGLFWAASSGLVFFKHAVVRTILHYYRKRGYNLKHIVVVGNGHLAHQYRDDIKKNPQFGYHIVGFFGKEPKEELGERLGSYEELGTYLENNDIDEIVIALEAHETQFMKYVLEAADKEGAKVTLIPFFNDYYPAHPSFETIGNSKTINLRATPLDNIGWAMIKRGLDVVGALLGIIIAGIPMIIVAIGVKLTSPGPVFFKQERVGLNKKPFMMIKFRSMKVNIDHNGWSTNDDDRKTKFGSFIRKVSLDELPQLFNVLAGHMSLVGPRPELPVFVSQFKEEIPLYLVRQQIRPGMTGWAQVNGLRGDTSIEERVKYDIYYIENWSVGLDFQILFKTVFGGMVNAEKLKK